MTAFTKGRKLVKEDIKRTALRKRGELNRWSPDVYEVLSMRKFDDDSFKYQIKGMGDRLFAQHDLKKVEAGPDMIRLGEYTSGNTTFNQGPKREQHLELLNKKVREKAEQDESDFEEEADENGMLRRSKRTKIKKKEDPPSKKKKRNKRKLAVRKGMKFEYSDGNTYTVQAMNATKGEVLAGDLLFSYKAVKALLEK
jgi:hypothetical protein